MNHNDPSALLPDGTYYAFWENETEYKTTLHVDGANPAASDANSGTEDKPFKTINAAAQVAMPGTRVLIKGGVYRETVRPARGGDGPAAMIAYEAAPGEKVEIKASEPATRIKPSTGWRLGNPFGPPMPGAEKVRLYEIELDPDMFRGYNPWNAINIMQDRYFIEYDKTDMTTYLNRRGMVFVDGKPLHQVAGFQQLGMETGAYWVESNGEHIQFRLANDDDPANHVIEIACREQCFAPGPACCSYIQVKDLIFAHAATCTPTPQRGAVSLRRGHHWIIEGCTIDWANGIGIDAGGEDIAYDRPADSILGFDLIRGNEIRDVGVCGIAAMGTTSLLIEDNLIYGTGWQRMELSWEAGGIKVHVAQNALFRRNIIAHTIGCDSIWMDVDNYNCRLTGNLLIDGIDSREHIFMEATRDRETMIDNNIIWNIEGRYDRSKIQAVQGSAPWYRDVQEEIANGYGLYGEGTDRLRISNNLIGKCNNAGYFAKVVAFRLMKRGGTSFLNKFYNNIFYDCGEAAIKMTSARNEAEGNAYGKMPFSGGYLRVLYPAPSLVLDLPSWQEFLGFDKEGVVSDISIEIDSTTWDMTVEVKTPLAPVTADPKSNSDYFTDGAPTDKRIPGPFPGLAAGKRVINIDPRRYSQSRLRGQ